MGRGTVTARFMQSGGREDPDSAENEDGLCHGALLAQNAAFHETGGVSRNNRAAGFLPGYCNVDTGEAVVSCFADGSPAPVHLLEGLPDAWVAERDPSGRVRQAVPAVVAGFIRDGSFYTREAAARFLDQGDILDSRQPAG
jgi:hypothetical protein